MEPGWAEVKWRPVVSYSRHHFKSLLGLLGKFSIYAVNALSLGDYAGHPTGVTEDLHRYSGGARSDQEWRKMREKENEEKRRRRNNNRNERRRQREGPTRRDLRMSVYDLKSFFICVPREEFLQTVLPDVIRRLEERFEGRPYF